MSRWDYGKGLPSVINGTAESEEQLLPLTSLSDQYFTWLSSAIDVKKMLDQIYAPMQIYKGKPKKIKKFQIKS